LLPLWSVVAHARTVRSQIGRVDAASRRSLVKGAAALRQMPTAAALLRVVVETRSAVPRASITPTRIVRPAFMR
jgi:hypothetical protein